MDQSGAGSEEPIEIRKYSNRRYYDSRHSRHVTLEEIHALICDGHEVRVTDAGSGADITAKVLAQIMLERDPPKLDVFPVPLLHRLIRANEQLVRDFVEKYFNQALSSFLHSQKQFEGYLRRVMGLQSDGTPARTPDWGQAIFGPFSPFWTAETGSRPEPKPQDSPGEADQELRKLVKALQQQVARMEGTRGGKRRGRGRSAGC